MYNQKLTHTLISKYENQILDHIKMQRVKTHGKQHKNNNWDKHAVSNNRNMLCCT